MGGYTTTSEEGIALVTRYSPFFSSTGVERSVQTLVEELLHRGMRVFSIFGSRRPRHLASLPFADTLAFNVNTLTTLSKLIARRLVRVISCHGVGPSPAFTLVSRFVKDGFPLLSYHAHDCIASELEATIRANVKLDSLSIARYKAMIRAERAAVDAADVIVSNSNATRLGITRSYGHQSNRSLVVPLSIPNELGKGLESVSPRTPLFLMIGAAKRRSTEVFLESLYVLRRRYGLSVSGVVLRDPAPTHVDLARQLHLDVEFLPYLNQDSLAKLYGSITSLVVPSVREGFCLPVLEAAAFGKPTIATKAGSLSEIITDEKDGILVDSLTADAFAEAMLSLLGDNRRYRLMSANAKAKSENYRASTVTQQLLSAAWNLS